MAVGTPYSTRYSSCAPHPQIGLSCFATGVESQQRQPLKVITVKMWPWNKLLIVFGWLLVVAGITPGALILVGLGTGHNQKPLSVPVSLKKGEFTSPYFEASAGGNYLIDLNWDMFPARQTSVDLDWKIVADNGTVIEQGAISNILRGANTLTIGSYKSASAQREQIVLNVHEDVDQGGAHATLTIGPEDTTTGLSSGIPGAAKLAAFVSIPGAILLLVLVIAGARRRKAASVHA